MSSSLMAHSVIMMPLQCHLLRASTFGVRTAMALARARHTPAIFCAYLKTATGTGMHHHHGSAAGARSFRFGSARGCLNLKGAFLTGRGHWHFKFHFGFRPGQDHGTRWLLPKQPNWPPGATQWHCAH
jgi:hypothetical protein